MEILPMLVRLEHALNCPDLARQMVLVPKASLPTVAEDIHLVVGYNGSARSQTALDLTLWIAHQTRLATRRAVTVQVVYVVDTDENRPTQCSGFPEFCFAPSEVPVNLPGKVLSSTSDRWESPEAVAIAPTATRSASMMPTDRPELPLPVLQTSQQQVASQLEQFEKADRILWQARYLADEWRGSLETHLRFGSLIDELRTVACQVSTTALVLGCSSPADPIVQALGHDLPFPILGIPAQIPGG